MRTSASCRLEPGDAGGFSLLELLIVLALASIVVAMVAPSLSRTVEAITVSGDRMEVQRQLEELPLLARQAGRATLVSAEEDLSSLSLPEGWRVTALSDVRIGENGVCMPARLQVTGGGLQEEWVLASPDCRVSHGP